MRILIVLLIAATAIAADNKTVATSKYIPQGYNLVWNDEFDGSTLDRKKWDDRYPGRRGPSVVTKDAVRLDGKGNLLLTTFLQQDAIQVGMIGTQGKFEQRYGYFEARIKFQKLQGHHGAFWLQSPTFGQVADDLAQSGAEVDIVEFFGSGRSDGGLQSNVYWNSQPQMKSAKKILDVAKILRRTGSSGSRGKEICNDFHVFALEWSEKEYKFFIDGLEVFRTSEGISQRSEYIVLSLLCSDWEVSRLDRRKLPDSMTVDYVRVYAKNP